MSLFQSLGSNCLTLRSSTQPSCIPKLNSTFVMPAKSTLSVPSFAGSRNRKAKIKSNKCASPSGKSILPTEITKAILPASFERSSEGKKDSSDLVVLPGACVQGYTSLDWFLDRDVARCVLQPLDKIIQATEGITAIVGTVRPTELTTGRRLYNSAAIIRNREVARIRRQNSTAGIRRLR